MASESRSAGSTDMPYFFLTATTRDAYQPLFLSGCHSAASLSDVRFRLTVGTATVKLSRSSPNSRNLLALNLDKWTA